MKSLTSGIFFLVAGALLLINNLGYLQLDFKKIEKYWPIILILLGISFIVINRTLKIVIKIIIGICLAIYLVAKFLYTKI